MYECVSTARNPGLAMHLHFICAVDKCCACSGRMIESNKAESKRGPAFRRENSDAFDRSELLEDHIQIVVCDKPR